jgi:hypothetical protein
MEENGVVIIEENGSVEAKKSAFHWAKLWAWSTLVLALVIPVVSLGVGILALSMTTEDNNDEVYAVSIIGMGIAAFFVILDFVLNFGVSF